jgi:hypothetical protein
MFFCTPFQKLNAKNKVCSLPNGLVASGVLTICAILNFNKNIGQALTEHRREMYPNREFYSLPFYYYWFL